MSEASIGTQWKKGQSGNPKGRPKKPKPLSDQGQMLTSIARWLLDQPCYLLGSEKPVTRQTRLMLDMCERAELGDYKAAKFLLELAARGDRLRLQAQRLALRAKTKEEARFERRSAERVSPRTPGLRPDQEHLIKPARELRTEHLKPARRPAPKKSNYEFDHWREPDPLAGIPKHLTKEERDRRDEQFRATIAAASQAPAREANSPSQTRPEAAPKPAPETGPKTGPITGLSNALKPHQAIDEVRKSFPRTNNDENFTVPGTLNGALVNGAHHNGPPA